jgi:hypothetical protein
MPQGAADGAGNRAGGAAIIVSGVHGVLAALGQPTDQVSIVVPAAAAGNPRRMMNCRWMVVGQDTFPGDSASASSSERDSSTPQRRALEEWGGDSGRLTATVSDRERYGTAAATHPSGRAWWPMTAGSPTSCADADYDHPKQNLSRG